ncbi:PREDICTED: mastermind-like protein 3 [Branchiostoma belcheri]|uniref:Mastermind-like protein 3 n=1 Tax=Branchiostoma belcheri TaxID=7741 RepID=A0A6P4YHX6_BRABE|nr:PREDICTED: mastermind-like protein 3 [Branchiostoma belcheri]
MGDLQSPKRRAIVDRLRARIELYRKHHNECQARDVQTQAARLQQERQDTLVLHQRVCDSRTKKSKGSKQEPVTAKMCKNDANAGGSSSADPEASQPQRSLLLTLKRKLGGSGSQASDPAADGVEENHTTKKTKTSEATNQSHNLHGFPVGNPVENVGAIKQSHTPDTVMKSEAGLEDTRTQDHAAEAAGANSHSPATNLPVECKQEPQLEDNSCQNDQGFPDVLNTLKAALSSSDINMSDKDFMNILDELENPEWPEEDLRSQINEFDKILDSIREKGDAGLLDGAVNGEQQGSPFHPDQKQQIDHILPTSDASFSKAAQDPIQNQCSPMNFGQNDPNMSTRMGSSQDGASAGNQRGMVSMPQENVSLAAEQLKQMAAQKQSGTEHWNTSMPPHQVAPCRVQQAVPQSAPHMQANPHPCIQSQAQPSRTTTCSGYMDGAGPMGSPHGFHPDQQPVMHLEPNMPGGPLNSHPVHSSHSDVNRAAITSLTMANTKPLSHYSGPEMKPQLPPISQMHAYGQQEPARPPPPAMKQNVGQYHPQQPGPAGNGQWQAAQQQGMTVEHMRLLQARQQQQQQQQKLNLQYRALPTHSQAGVDKTSSIAARNAVQAQLLQRQQQQQQQQQQHPGMPEHLMEQHMQSQMQHYLNRPPPDYGEATAQMKAQQGNPNFQAMKAGVPAMGMSGMKSQAGVVNPHAVGFRQAEVKQEIGWSQPPTASTNQVFKQNVQHISTAKAHMDMGQAQMMPGGPRDRTHSQSSMQGFGGDMPLDGRQGYNPGHPPTTQPLPPHMAGPHSATATISTAQRVYTTSACRSTSDQDMWAQYQREGYGNAAPNQPPTSAAFTRQGQFMGGSFPPNSQDGPMAAQNYSNRMNMAAAHMNQQQRQLMGQMPNKGQMTIPPGVQMMNQSGTNMARMAQPMAMGQMPQLAAYPKPSGTEFHGNMVENLPDRQMPMGPNTNMNYMDPHDLNFIDEVIFANK